MSDQRMKAVQSHINEIIELCATEVEKAIGDHGGAAEAVRGLKIPENGLIPKIHRKVDPAYEASLQAKIRQRELEGW